MIHRLTIGHLDPHAVRDGRTVVVKPLQLDVVSRVLEQYATKNEDGTFWFRHTPVRVTEGYIVCDWLVPSIRESVEAFARQLQAETGCIAADVQHGEVVDLSQR